MVIVQVSRKRRKTVTDPSSTSILEYIWTNNDAERQRQTKVQYLEIGQREFYLTLQIPSGISPDPESVVLEWPEKVNWQVDACQALEFLEKKKNEGPKKQ